MSSAKRSKSKGKSSSSSSKKKDGGDKVKKSKSSSSSAAPAAASKKKASSKKGKDSLAGKLQRLDRAYTSHDLAQEGQPRAFKRRILERPVDERDKYYATLGCCCSPCAAGYIQATMMKPDKDEVPSIGQWCPLAMVYSFCMPCWCCWCGLLRGKYREEFNVAGDEVEDYKEGCLLPCCNTAMILRDHEYYFDQGRAKAKARRKLEAEEKKRKKKEAAAKKKKAAAEKKKQKKKEAAEKKKQKEKEAEEAADGVGDKKKKKSSKQDGDAGPSVEMVEAPRRERRRNRE